MVGYFQMLNEKGGINGRRVNLISLDNAFSPPKAIEQTRKLVEDDGVLAEVGTVGTVPNVAVQKYLNQNKVPQVFISAGGRRFNDPQNFPWTVPFYPPFEMEGATFGTFILNKMPNAKIAVLYQNDDYGKDYLAGLKAGLGSDRTAKIVAEPPTNSATRPLTPKLSSSRPRAPIPWSILRHRSLRGRRSRKPMS
jgi:ABC-type branched-subunit amino acid transport system substrate-binding protein